MSEEKKSVRLRTVLAGPKHSGQPGQVVEVSKKMAADLIDGGFAEEYVPPKPAKERETATAGPKETADLNPKKADEAAAAFASAAAATFAKKHGITAEDVQGSGADGKIIMQDLRDYLAAKDSAESDADADQEGEDETAEEEDLFTDGEKEA